MPESNVTNTTIQSECDSNVPRMRIPKESSKLTIESCFGFAEFMEVCEMDSNR